MTSVALNKKTSALKVGESEQLEAKVKADGVIITMGEHGSWKSTHPELLTVSDTGLVTAVALGTGDIVVTTKVDGFTAKCTYTITE